jgi:hypothetical protein
MSNLRPVSTILIFAALSVGAGWAGRAIPFSEQWPFYEALRTTAAIVFAVMGVWVTLLYPQALELVIKRRNFDKSPEEDRIRALLLPVKLSTAVLIVVLLVGPLSVLLKHLPILTDELPLARGSSFGFLVFLTFAEMAAVFLTLWPIDSAKAELNAARCNKESDEARFKLVQKH